MAEIDRLSGGQAIVASDVGQHQMWAAQFIRFNEPRLWLNSGGLGSMGFGLPAAIGAQFARPDKLVFAVVGDGGFQMSIPELATLVNYGLPGQDRDREQRLPRDGAPVAGALLQQPALLGGTGHLPRRGETRRRLRLQGPDHRAARTNWPPRCRQAVDEPGPYLLNVKVSPPENVYPMVPGRQRHQ